jgi:hypothetical protein
MVEMVDRLAARVGQAHQVQPQLAKATQVVHLTMAHFLLMAVAAEKAALVEMEMRPPELAALVVMAQIHIQLGTQLLAQALAALLLGAVAVRHQMQQLKVRLDQVAEVLVHTAQHQLMRPLIQVRDQVAYQLHHLLLVTAAQD